MLCCVRFVQRGSVKMCDITVRGSSSENLADVPLCSGCVSRPAGCDEIIDDESTAADRDRDFLFHDLEQDGDLDSIPYRELEHQRPFDLAVDEKYVVFYWFGFIVASAKLGDC